MRSRFEYISHNIIIFLVSSIILLNMVFVFQLALWIQLLHHVITALFLGGIFFDIGNDAAKPITNFKFCFTIVIFFTYTYLMVPILICKSFFNNSILHKFRNIFATYQLYHPNIGRDQILCKYFD